MSLSSDKAKALLDYLGGYITAHKKQRIEEVLACRTRYLTILLENVYYSQNASALVRTADCYGLMDMHVVEDKFAFKANPHVVRGAAKWVDFYRYADIRLANEALKAKGYQTVATTPHAQLTLDELPLDKPLAMVFGTEQDGLSATAMQLADYQVRIPIFGFTESFNVSVSAAISLHALTQRLHQSTVPWQLSTAEKEIIRLDWYRKVVQRSELLEQRFMQEKG